MCGILCVCNIAAGAESYRSKVLDRARRMRHRGPDWSGTHLAGDHILQHERLSIVDPMGGAQPIKNDKGTLILCVNGEIYNHLDIKSKLSPKHTFTTGSDCEAVMHLYAEHGAAAVVQWMNQLEGMFGFCLYDEEKDVFIVARDHLGIIPLYYGTDEEGAMWFASEMKSLNDACVEFQSFPPGHVYVGGAGAATADAGLKRWYEPAWFDGTHMPTEQVTAAQLRESLEKSVVSHLMSDVPYGCLLSGGLDSSIIAAVAAKHARRRIEDEGASEAHWPRLHTFSIGLTGSPDLAAAQKVADHIGSVHHGLTFTIDEGLNALSDVIYHLETFDTTTIRAATPMYLLARKIKCLGIKMLLSGEGADEIFGGYLYFFKAPDDKAFQAELVQKLKDLHLYDNLRANKSTAAWGIEARVPFLSKTFLDECAMKMDPALKRCYSKGNPGGKEPKIEKSILREAFEDLLPPDIAWRQKEQFSDGVGYGWIDGLKDWAEAKVSDKQLQQAPFRFPVSTPLTKESYYYRSIFERHYPQRSAALGCIKDGPSIACSTAAAVEWDAAFKELADCSGRAVSDVHDAGLNAAERKRETGRVMKENASASSS